MGRPWCFTGWSLVPERWANETTEAEWTLLIALTRGQVLPYGSPIRMKDACVAALATMQERAEPVLIEGVISPCYAVREVCVRALEGNPSSPSQAALLSVLQGDEEANTRYQKGGDRSV